MLKEDLEIGVEEVTTIDGCTIATLYARNITIHSIVNHSG